MPPLAGDVWGFAPPGMDALADSVSSSTSESNTMTALDSSASSQGTNDDLRVLLAQSLCNLIASLDGNTDGGSQQTGSLVDAGI